MDRRRSSSQPGRDVGHRKGPMGRAGAGSASSSRSASPGHMMGRPEVNALHRLFSESESDRRSKEVVGDIRDYNKRYSGAPRKVMDYLCDAPLLLHLWARGLTAVGGLVCLFFFRVALCCVGTVVSFSSHPLHTVSPSSSPSSSSLETYQSLCGLLGILDDLVVVVLLLICVINIHQQMAPERGRSASALATREVL
ncbi:unnamed protein product [Merluccius merluccius]